MRKNKNALMSLGFFIAAPAWYTLWLLVGWACSAHLAQFKISSDVLGVLEALVVLPYFVFLITGIFFGWRNLKSERPSVIGNVMTLLGIIVLLGSVCFIFEMMAWSG